MNLTLEVQDRVLFPLDLVDQCGCTVYMSKPTFSIFKIFDVFAYQQNNQMKTG